jgi:hypothetical protein
MKPATKEKRAKYLPLEVSEKYETHKESGIKIKVTEFKRGVMRLQERRFDRFSLAAFDTEDPRKSLEQLCNSLRDRLEALGLPSDRTPHWIMTRDNQWRSVDAETIVESQSVKRSSLWTSRVDDLSEPLSEGRLTADLLFHLVVLLEMENIDHSLWNVAQVMRSYSQLRISALNELASAGATAIRVRANGPKSKMAKALEVREIICQHSKLFWAKRPQLEGDASNTAAHIAEAVNTELNSRRLLPPSRKLMATKTIADHIRHGIQDKIL